VDEATHWTPDPTAVEWGKLWARVDAQDQRLDVLAAQLEAVRRQLMWLMGTTLVGPIAATLLSHLLH